MHSAIDSDLWQVGSAGHGRRWFRWSTAIARLYMAAVLVGYLLLVRPKHRTELLQTPVDIDLPRIRRLITLGLPAAIQFTLESGVFALVTALIAQLGPVPLASHQIALNTVAFTYMVRSASLPRPPCAWARPSDARIPKQRAMPAALPSFLVLPS